MRIRRFPPPRRSLRAAFVVGLWSVLSMGSRMDAAGEDEAKPDENAVPVAFVQLDEAAAQIFESRPPGALDYAVLMQHLVGFKPSVVALADVVSWPDLQPPHRRILASKLSTMNLVWGAVLDADPVEPAPESIWDAWLSLGTAGAWPELALCPGVTVLPERSLWDFGKIGFVQLDFGPRIESRESHIAIPIVARAGKDRVVAGLPLVAWIRAQGWEASEVVVDAEAGAVTGPEGFRVPIDPQGKLQVPLSLRERLEKWSASAFLPSMANGPVEARLAEKALVVLGGDDPGRRVLMLADGGRISRAEVMALAVLALATDTWMVPPAAESELAEGDEDGAREEVTGGESTSPVEAGGPVETAAVSRAGVPEDGWLGMAGLVAFVLLWWSLRLHVSKGGGSAGDDRDA